MFRTLLIVATLACTSVLQGQIVLTPIAPVKVEGGIVAGKVLESGVKAWFGVPFAKPPVNELRWQAPQPVTWSGTWNADRKMPECMQVLRPHNINHYFGEEATSEDCLYLNIWAPPHSAGNAKLPVIVFLYGGGGTIGSAGSLLYDGENMAKKGVVFITVGYRVGIFGWMAHPELTKEQGGHSGNYAYLDQNAALKWIHTNIGRFGGDPSHVLLTGQSAGAGSVAAQMHSPLSKGLFQGAMMSSACVIGTGGAGTSLADAEKTGLEIQKRLGASDLAHLRYVAADRIVALQSENQLGYNNSAGIRTGAIVDGYFTTKSKEEMAASHEMSDIPFIGNFNSGEAAGPFDRATSVAEYNQIASQVFGKDAEAFLALYPVRSDAEVVPMARTVAREAGIANNSRNCGVLQTRYNKSKAYLDMFDRKHSYADGVELADQNTATIGAYHTSDIPFFFENLDVFNVKRKTRNWTADDRAMADKMSDSLIAFARTGDPNTAAVKWPAWTPANDSLMVFGATPHAERFHAKGMEWLAAHPMRNGAAGRPGMVPGGFPRD